MAVQADISEKITEQAKKGGRLRRRGVIAGVAALAAGVIASRTTEPVGATSGAGTSGALIMGSNNSNTPNTETQATLLQRGAGAPVNFAPALFSVECISAPPGNNFTDTVSGIFAHATGAGTAIYGYSGVSAGTIGLAGTGFVNNSFGVVGSADQPGSIGVQGTSMSGTGVFGQTNASFNYGVLGTTYAANSTAVAGTCTGNGSSAFSGGTVNPAAYAGVFQGNVVIQGKLVVSDPSYKSGALLHPDGSHRLVYCVESPESWIEDVGKGTLAGGKVTVTFDKDFAAVVHTDDYHVFLTSYDAANKGLAVVNRTETGFVVQEQNGGTSSGGFSWRVMVKPKSTVKSERLAKFVMPNLPLPDGSKLPKANLPKVDIPKP